MTNGDKRFTTNPSVNGTSHDVIYINDDNVTIDINGNNNSFDYYYA
jgi:hypothetical protein